jgi:transposase
VSCVGAGVAASIEGIAMAKRGRPTVEITLTPTERRQLESWARRHSSAQSLALRCKVILACADPDLSRQEIADRVGCNPATVTKWRNRFARQRLDGLIDEPRPGAARSIGDDVIEQVVIDTLESAPADATHWSTRSLAAKHGISHETVSQIWQAFGLKPWRQDEFKISPDPQLVDKVRDLVGLYMNPPVNAAVFAVDEKPQVQALNRTAPTLPMLPTPARATHDYQRNGTIDLFAALNVATGKVISDLRPTHTSAEFIKFLNKINREVPAQLDVHVILDNLSTHKTPAVHKWLLRHRRFHFHFTPTYGSWMNLVERWFSTLTTKKLQRSAHDSVRALAADINTWVDHWNTDPKPFVWHKTADEILGKLARYCAAVTHTEYSDAST